jgi:class 3 adenylate cyclase
MNTLDEAGAGYMVLRDLDATHDRRVRLLIVLTSTVLTLLGFGLFLVFLVEGRWINCAFESPIWIVGLTGAILTKRGQMRAAALLMVFSLFAIFCAITLFGDSPTQGIPRTTHLTLIPIAFGSYIALKKESRWIRNGFLLLCLSAVALFSITSFSVDVGLFLPEELHLLVNWVISVGSMAVLYFMLIVYMGDVGRMESYLHRANNQFVSLVSGMFPKVIAERLLAEKQTFAERYTNCTVLFADIVGFTGITERMTPEKLVGILNDVFLRFDQCVEKSGLTKIKTIGDAYMVASGIPESDAEHAKKMVVFATQMLEVVKDFQDIELRIGIASGELVAGVIGQTRQVYDVWGDVVNLASRIESMGTANHIQVSETTYSLVKNDFLFTERSGLTIKGKSGTHNVYVLNGDIVRTEPSTH